MKELYTFETVLSNDPRVQRMNPPAPVKCKFCGQIRYTTGLVLAPNEIWWSPAGAEICKCEQAQKEYQAEKAQREKAEAEKKQREQQAERNAYLKSLIEQSGLGRRFILRTFENFKPNASNQKALQFALGYVKNFNTLNNNAQSAEKNSLYIAGNRGTGKTHLVCAIANRLMTQGVKVVFSTMIDLLANIKSSYDAKEGETEQELIERYKNCDLLIIDDMGKEQPTEWALSKMFQIINARYEDLRPIIVTSNYNPDALIKRLTPANQDEQTAGALIDRLYEMSYTLNLLGDSYRTHF